VGIVLSPYVPERVAPAVAAERGEQARGAGTAASLAVVADSGQAHTQRRGFGALTRWSAIVAALAAVAIVAGVVLALSGGAHDHGAAAAGTHAVAAKTTGRAGAIGGSTGSAGAKGATSTTGSASGLSPASAGTQSPPTPSASGGSRRAVAEVADPEESNSFPAPAGVRHKAAVTPKKASDAVVAAGAPSDAEVKQELAQMHAVERSAKHDQQQRLQPVPGGNSVGGDGTIPIPANVPEAVQRVIAGANAIADFPYVFGGGHGSFVDNAYDCSGSVSYALAAGGLLSAPETSGELESWGAPGPGRYITIEAAAGHVYMYVDGVMYNTAGRSGVYASRWQVKPVDNSGYVTRHWPGL
jgi:cell wall-associated NlpC family hydrolase